MLTPVDPLKEGGSAIIAEDEVMLIDKADSPKEKHVALEVSGLTSPLIMRLTSSSLASNKERANSKVWFAV